MNTSTIYRGRVVFFKPEKGYGFIKREDTGEDVFVHYTSIDGRGYRNLSANQMVEFEIGPAANDRGRVQAKNVKVIQ